MLKETFDAWVKIIEKNAEAVAFFSLVLVPIIVAASTLVLNALIRERDWFKTKSTEVDDARKFFVEYKKASQELIDALQKLRDVEKEKLDLETRLDIEKIFRKVSDIEVELQRKIREVQEAVSSHDDRVNEAFEEVYRSESVVKKPWYKKRFWRPRRPRR